MVDSVLWRCARCRTEFIGGRTPDDLCTACIAAAFPRPALTGDLNWVQVTVTADGATKTTGMPELRIPLPPPAAAQDAFYVLICRECGNGDLVMPFGSAGERGRWASEHTRGTGHDRWFVKDVPA